jgi:hypothetical protein
MYVCVYVLMPSSSRFHRRIAEGSPTSNGNPLHVRLIHVHVRRLLIRLTASPADAAQAPWLRDASAVAPLLCLLAGESATLQVGGGMRGCVWVWEALRPRALLPTYGVGAFMRMTWP